MEKINVNITSEKRKHNAVLTHTPGKEVEKGTTVNAERASYIDILNLNGAVKVIEDVNDILDIF